MVLQSILKAQHLLDFITASPAGVLFDNLETEERISSLNLNITGVMRAAVILQDRFRFQNYFDSQLLTMFFFREML